MIELTSKKDCTGCHACENICSQHCISMNMDDEGFWYPKVNMEICTNCGLCERICPILHHKQVRNEPQAFACYNKNEEMRIQSSSGGLFNTFAEQVIRNGGIVFGACFDEDFAVAHYYTRVKEELEKFRGSKYVQSRIGDMYKQAKKFLEEGKQVLFTGTPCQIGGLKAYLQNDYDNLLCIDIICHGVPSPKVWKKYVSFQESNAGYAAREIAFRCKDKGWKRFSVSFLFKNDSKYIETYYKDLYMKAFLRNICLRPSCYECKYKTLNRQSDVTLADFWGIHNLLPEIDDDKGISLVFINSIKGNLMFDEIKSWILYKKVDIHKAVSYNPSAVKSVEENPKRKSFFKDLDKISFDKLVDKYCTDGFMVRTINKMKKTGYRFLKKLDS